jgi:hypothetical protein
MHLMLQKAGARQDIHSHLWRSRWCVTPTVSHAAPLDASSLLLQSWNHRLLSYSLESYGKQLPLLLLCRSRTHLCLTCPILLRLRQFRLQPQFQPAVTLRILIFPQAKTVCCDPHAPDDRRRMRRKRRPIRKQQQQQQQLLRRVLKQ